MIRVRVFPLLALLVAGMATPAWSQYGGYGGPGMMGRGMGGPGMGPYSFGGPGMYGEGGVQAPNFVIVKEGEAIYCAVYGDLIDYRVYPKQVPVDEVAGNYFDDGTHGDEVPYDGIPSNIEENRDTYLGPFAIKYKNMLKKMLINSIITVMNQGPFAMLEKARSKALLDNRDALFNKDLDEQQFRDMLAEFTTKALEKEKAKARDPKRIEMIAQTIRLTQNTLLLKLYGEAKQKMEDKHTFKRMDPIEFFRIPVVAESRKSKLVQSSAVTMDLTSKIEDWTETLLGQFIGPDGVPYDDQKYRFRLDVNVLQNQQGLGMGGYGGAGMAGMYGGAGGATTGEGTGGPAGMYAVDRARKAAAGAAEAPGGTGSLSAP